MKKFLHPTDNPPGGDTPDKGGKQDPNVIKVGDKEITAEELGALLSSKAADSVKVQIQWKGQMVDKTLGELRGGGMRQEDYTRGKQALAEKEQQLLQKEQELEQKRTDLEQKMASASTDQMKVLADALRTALGDKQETKRPLDTRSTALAYIKSKLDGPEAADGILEILDEVFTVKERTKAEMDAVVADLKKEIADLKGTMEQRELLAYIREQRRQTAAVVPEYGQDTAFGRLVRALTDDLARSDKPDQDILEGMTGADMKPWDVAKKVVEWLDKTSDGRVADRQQKKEEEERRATQVRASEGQAPAVPDEILKEIEEAGKSGDRERLGKAYEKIAALRGLQLQDR